MTSQMLLDLLYLFVVLTAFGFLVHGVVMIGYACYSMTIPDFDRTIRLFSFVTGMMLTCLGGSVCISLSPFS